MNRFAQLLIAAIASIALILLATGTSAAPEPRLAKAAVVPGAQASDRALAVSCGHPAKLRFIRFEDGSALLRCGGRILVRVSVPG